MNRSDPSAECASLEEEIVRLRRELQTAEATLTQARVKERTLGPRSCLSGLAVGLVLVLLAVLALFYASVMSMRSLG